MRTAVFGIGACTTLMAFDMNAFIPTPAIQGGALAVLGWVIIYILTRVLPSYRKEMEDERKRNAADFKKKDRRFCRTLNVLAESMRDIASKKR